MKNLFWVSLCLLFLSCMTASDRTDLANEYLSLAEAYYEMENYKKAITLYEKSLVYENTVEINYNLTLACIKAKEYSQAETCLDRFTPEQKETALYKELVGFFALSKEDYPAAFKSFQELYDLDTTRMTVLDNLILVSIKLNDSNWERNYKLRKWELTGTSEDLKKILELYKEAELWSDMEILLLKADSGHTAEFALYWAYVYRQNNLSQESLNSLNIWLESEINHLFGEYLLKLAILIIDMKDFESAYDFVKKEKELFEKNREEYEKFLKENFLTGSDFVTRIEELVFNAD